VLEEALKCDLLWRATNWKFLVIALIVKKISVDSQTGLLGSYQTTRFILLKNLSNRRRFSGLERLLYL